MKNDGIENKMRGRKRDRETCDLKKPIRDQINR